MKSYEITFITKAGGFKKWIIHVEASKKAAALVKAKTMWEANLNLNKMHRFNIKGRVLWDTEEFLYHYFTVID